MCEPQDGWAPPSGVRIPAGRWWESFDEALLARGLSLDVGYTHVWQDNARGGRDTRHGRRHMGSYDVILQLDTERARLWKDGLFNVWMEGSFGRDISEMKVGSIVGVNGDFCGESDFRVATAWYEHAFLGDRILLRLGKQDGTDSFDTNRYANDEVVQFLNAGLVNNPAVPFPDRGLGVQIRVVPTDWCYGLVGVLDAEGQGGRTGFDTAFGGPAHFFVISEYGVASTFARGRKTYPGAYRAGYWYDPTPKELFIQPEPGHIRVRNGDWGAYVSLDQRIWKETDGNDDQGVGLFLRYGFAHGDVNAVTHAWSYGLSCTGPIASRDADVLALGISHTCLSEALGHVEPGLERETAVELYYNIYINKWMQLTPDVQFVVDPGGSDNVRNAIVVGIRLAAYF